MQHSSDAVTLSIIVPVYSGAKFLDALVKQIDELKARWTEADINILINEVIFVLDAPKDDSHNILTNLNSDYDWIRLVNLSRNYGQHSATVAGILYSSGDWVVTIDEDLQHEPRNIENLLIEAGSRDADVVYALPRESVHGGGYRDILSKFAKFLISKLSGNQFVRSFNSFRLIRGDIARAASSICAQYTYFDVALTWFTDRIVSVKLDLSDERYKQEKSSGYRFSTLIQHAKRLILTSDFRMLRLTTSLALITFFVSVLYGGWVIYSRFFSVHPVEVEGWTSLMIVLLAFGSVSVFILGLIVEILHMSMLQLQGKPAFFVVSRSSESSMRQHIEKLKKLCKS